MNRQTAIREAVERIREGQDPREAAAALLELSMRGAAAAGGAIGATGGAVVGASVGAGTMGTLGAAVGAVKGRREVKRRLAAGEKLTPEQQHAIRSHATKKGARTGAVSGAQILGGAGALGGSMLGAPIGVARHFIGKAKRDFASS